MLAQTVNNTCLSRNNQIKVILELTNGCNFDCPHCFRDKSQRISYLPLDFIRKILTEVRRYFPDVIIAFTGGEPLLHPELGQIVQSVCELGAMLRCVTNGWLFAERFPLFKPYLTCLDLIQFSLDGATEEVHDTFRQKPGSFRRTMQGVCLCRLAKIPFTIAMVIDSRNRHEIEPMALLAARLGAKGLAYAHCLQRDHDADEGGNLLTRYEKQQIEYDIAQLQEMFTLPIYLAGNHYDTSPLADCSPFQMKEFNINYLGQLTLCCQLSNYGVADHPADIITDLNSSTFAAALDKLIDEIASLQKKRMHAFFERNGDRSIIFSCDYCLNHFHQCSKSSQPFATATDTHTEGDQS